MIELGSMKNRKGKSACSIKKHKKKGTQEAKYGPSKFPFPLKTDSQWLKLSHLRKVRNRLDMLKL